MVSTLGDVSLVEHSFYGSSVLITGATGFIGRWLTSALLASGADVIAFVRDSDPSALFRIDAVGNHRLTVVSGVVEDYSSIERAVNEYEPRVVFHLAAQTLVGPAFRSPLPTFESNIRGTYHILEACRRLKGIVDAVVVASSDKSYGTAAVLPYSEDTPLKGEHPYDVSKSCADLVARSYGITYDLPVAIARCGNVFGGGDTNWSRIVPGTIRSAISGIRPVLRSDGTPTRDYIYIQDVVSGYLRLAHRTVECGYRGEAFNFSIGEPMSALDMVRLILEQLDMSELQPDIQDNARAEISHQHLDSTRARTELEWVPSFGLRDGLSVTIDWYRSFFTETEG